MTELFVGKAAVPYAEKVGGGTISGYNEVDQLEIGALAIFTEDGTLITTATTPASIALVKQFYMCVGEVDKDGNNVTKRSRLIDRAAFHRTYCAYVAPVKQAKSVGFNGTSGSLNLPGTLIAGTLASMSVGIQDEGVEPHVHWSRYEYLVQTGDVEADVVNGIVAAINADDKPFARWTANAEGSTGITVTADEFGRVLEIAVDDLFLPSDRSTKTDIVYGKGTPTQIREYELLSQIEDGDTNRVHYETKFFKKPSQVDSAAQYDTYTFEWLSEHRTAKGVEDGYVKEAVIAIPAGAQATALNTIITTILLLSPTNTTGGSATGI